MGLPTRTRGYVAIILAAVLFGIWPTLSKLVLTNAVSPLAVAFLIQVIPGATLLPFVRRARIDRADWRLIVLSGVVGAVIGPLIYFYGLELTTASNSVLLSNSESLFTMLFAYAFLRERASRREYLALGGIAAGAFIVTTQLRFGEIGVPEFVVGNVMLVAAAVCWGGSNTMSTVLLRRIAIVLLLEIQLAIGAAVFAAVVIVTATPLDVPLNVLPALILLSLSAVGVFSLLFFYAFRSLGAMRTGAVLPTSALWGLLFAHYVLPLETLSPVQLTGGALMVGSLVAFYLLRGPSEEEPGVGTLKPAASDCPDSP